LCGAGGGVQGREWIREMTYTRTSKDLRSVRQGLWDLHAITPDIRVRYLLPRAIPLMDGGLVSIVPLSM
jgi:hypothetical protein